jgi:proteasome accessory factor B
LFVVTMSDAKKTRGWIDFLAALLSHHYPVTFEEIAKDVPAYDTSKLNGDKTKLASLKKMFERDKAELLEQGVPLISVSEPGEEEYKYQLRSKDFYLPYLGIATRRGLKSPRTVDAYGCRSLAKLGFEPDELEAVAEGARLVTQTGDPTLIDDTRSALRKLAFDLPLGATEGSDAQIIVQPRSRAEPGNLAKLGDGLFRRKQVTFCYHGIDAKQDTDRTCEPYGLFFLNGHWYLVARDAAKDSLRNFRVSRMTDERANANKPQSSDYTIPATFSLREHARSREAWEIGDGDAYEAVVEFSGKTGPAIAAAALGRADASSPSLRRFHVRRTDSFARWLLTFAGEAKPVAPEALLKEYAEIVKETRAKYSRQVVA